MGYYQAKQSLGLQHSRTIGAKDKKPRKRKTLHSLGEEHLQKAANDKSGTYAKLREMLIKKGKMKERALAKQQADEIRKNGMRRTSDYTKDDQEAIKKDPWKKERKKAKQQADEIRKNGMKRTSKYSRDA